MPQRRHDVRALHTIAEREQVLARNRDTGRPRGFGFVEMANSEDADGAVKELDGYSMDGRALKVNEARERSSGGGGGGGGGGRDRRY